MHMKMSFKHPLGRSQRLASNVNVVEAQPPPLWTHRRVRALATYVTGRRRTVQMSAMRGSFPGQGSYGLGFGASGMRPMQRPRTLQQLVDILSGGDADDPEQFLQLLTVVPRLLGPQRVLSPPSKSRDPIAGTASERYARLKQLQQLRLQQQRQKASGDSSTFDAQRWAQRKKEEEQRWDVMRAAMLQNARRHLLQYDTPSLARLASGLAIAGIQDPALCDEMLLQVIKQQQYLQQQQQQQKGPQQLQQLQALSDPRSLAELLDAFAAMRHRPTDAQLAEVLRLQQQEQQAVEQSRLRQAQAQQVIGSQPRLELRVMGMPPEAKLPPQQQQPGPGYATSRGGSTSMSPEDAARLLYALSRLGYIPDEGTLTQLLEQLQPHRLQLQPAVPHLNGQASKARRSPARRELAVEQQGQMQGSRPQEELMRWAAVQAKPEAQVCPQPKPERPLELRQQSSEELASEEYEEQKDLELQDKLSYSLQRDAQAVLSAVRALQRMGRPAKAQQLREGFTQHVRDMQAQVMQENEEEEEEAEREGMAGAEAAAAAMVALRKKEEQLLQEAADVKRRRKEEQVRALRQQLVKKLQSADQWQQIRALLFTYQEALDAECLVAAAAQLGELLAALRRTGRGLAMTLRDRGDLGDLLEGLGQLVLRQLDGATSAQVSSLFCSMVRLRHLEEGLLVGLLRRLRDVLEDARPRELAAVLGALADCGVRPSKHWMEAFLRRCEALLEQFSPGELAALPVSLAQLGAHPGPSWLGAYLDSLQTREGELSQSAVSEAVRAVALIDRPFLSAWRQAAAVREQQNLQARTAATDAVAAVAKQQPAEEPLWHMQQRELEQPYTSALASIEDMLAELGVRQDPPIEAGQETSFPPMHPKQRSMLEQQPESTSSIVFTQQEHPAERPQAVAQAQAATDTDPQVKSASFISENVPTSHSVELDVESADLSYSGGVIAAGSSPSSELEAVANSPAGASAFSAGRQLPGSFSIDGYYNLDPYGEYEEQEDKWNEDTGEGEYVDGGVEVVAEEMEEDHVEQLALKVGCASEDEEALRQSSTLAAAPAAVVTHANSEGVDMEPTVHGGAGVEIADGALPGITLASSATASPQLGHQGQLGAQDVPVRMHVHECGDQAQQQQQQGRPDHGAQAQNTGALQEVQQEKQQEATSLKQQKQVAWQGESLDGQGDISMQQLGMEEAKEAPPNHPKQPTAEELSQARALRSLLLERYEAVAAYRNELEEQESREAEAAAEGRGDGKFSKREVAAAAKVLAAREQLQRLQADYDNFKRRASEERQQALARARADVLRPILAVADNFERAATQIKPKADGERVLHETYQSVYAKLEEFLEMTGVQEVGVQGEAFDPNLHEAVMREDRDDVEDGTVTCVFQKGYRLGDILVRPALVKVAYS